jgi:hypothetical protein
MGRCASVLGCYDGEFARTNYLEGLIEILPGKQRLPSGRMTAVTQRPEVGRSDSGVRRKIVDAKKTVRTVDEAG